VGADVEADWTGADEVAPDEANGRGPAVSLDLQKMEDLIPQRKGLEYIISRSEAKEQTILSTDGI
jgi:hypothetical protein